MPDLLWSFEINYHRPKCLQLWYKIPLPLEGSKKGTLTLHADPIAPSVQVDNLTVVNICFMGSDTIAQWDCEKENILQTIRQAEMSMRDVQINRVKNFG